MMTTEAKYLTLQQVADVLTDELGFNGRQVKDAIRCGKLRAIATEYAIEPSAVDDFRQQFVRLNGEGKPIIRRPRRGKAKRGPK